MAQEGSSEASVASSSPAGSWWETMSSNSSSWNAMINHGRYGHPQASNSCDDQDISISTNSFTNPSNHSTASDSHLWNQVLLGVENSEGMQQISSQKSFIRSSLMFDPACDYLKKLEEGWELTSNSSALISSLEKQLIIRGYHSGGDGDHSAERLTTTNLTDLVSNWSIAPPNPPHAHHHHHHLDNPMNNPNSSAAHIKHEAPGAGNTFPRPPTFHSYTDHDDENGGFGNTPVIGLKNRGLMASDTTSWSINSLPTTNLSVDLISFSPVVLNKPAPFMEFRGSSASTSSCKAGHRQLPSSSSSSSSRKGGGRGRAGGDQGKKKRSDRTSDTLLFKKPKHDTSTSSPPIITKAQAPKVKVGDKITALQQIVSPFGKTDTASVLLEAIKYIRFLQEQVQLLSDPYLKSNANKDHSTWPGSMVRKEKGHEAKHDLRGRGLCLVPISCTPQACRENSGPDYWTPPFRGCLYR